LANLEYVVPSVNMLDAKSQLSRLVEAVESGSEAEIVIARNGKPAARLVPLDARPTIRLGLARGKYLIPDAIDADAEVIADGFERGA
jgi:prevent-host-death family protein